MAALHHLIISYIMP